MKLLQTAPLGVFPGILSLLLSSLLFCGCGTQQDDPAGKVLRIAVIPKGPTH